MTSELLSKAQLVWDEFCGGLKQEPTDDMKEALCESITEIMVQLTQYPNPQDSYYSIIDAKELSKLRDELEKLNYDK
jgi:hypothetical protein